MEDRQLLRLRSIEVDGLFGMYNHRIDLNLDDRVTILHGQNGVGKTTVLRMITALLRNDIPYFRRVPFTRFLLIFEDSSRLELMPIESNTENDMVTLTLTKEDRRKETDDVEIRSDAEFLAARTGFLERDVDTGNTWIDVRDGEVLTEIDVLSRYGESRHEYSHQEKVPWLGEFLLNVNAHLIEAQRLIRAPFDPRYRRRAYRYPIPTSNVVKCSQDFKNRFDYTMTAYGRRAQTLDQTFPQRLMTKSVEMPIPDIQARMKELAEKTENYKTIGILDETDVDPFDTDSLGTLDDTRASAMSLYVQDREIKLKELEDLANRTRHLLDGINEKFRHKELRLDREEGLVAQGKENQNLPLDSLSSGEQHELVLYYELLFKTRPNAVVLIDEPEISLHVAWQKSFLPDLMEIVQVSNFDVVVATHSPYIVGDRADLMVGLGDPD